MEPNRRNHAEWARHCNNPGNDFPRGSVLQSNLSREHNQTSPASVANQLWAKRLLHRTAWLGRQEEPWQKSSENVWDRIRSNKHNKNNFFKTLLKTQQLKLLRTSPRNLAWTARHVQSGLHQSWRKPAHMKPPTTPNARTDEGQGELPVRVLQPACRQTLARSCVQRWVVANHRRRWRCGG